MKGWSAITVDLFVTHTHTHKKKVNKNLYLFIFCRSGLVWFSDGFLSRKLCIGDVTKKQRKKERKKKRKREKERERKREKKRN